MRHLDSHYFAQLITTTRQTVERRIVFLGLIEHFDALLPIEQSIYPDNYRSVQQRQLQRELALYGPLPFHRSIAELLDEMSPRQLLTLAAEKTVNPRCS